LWVIFALLDPDPDSEYGSGSTGPIGSFVVPSSEEKVVSFLIIVSRFYLLAGQGLGRHSQGMVDALKPKLKFDQAGIGKKFLRFW
jgi:hypothetical protein